MTNICLVVLRIFVETNFIPGFVGHQDLPIKAGPDGYYPRTMIVDAVYREVHRMPMNQIITNYVIGIRNGTNTFELFTAKGEPVTLPFKAE